MLPCSLWRVGGAWPCPYPRLRTVFVPQRYRITSARNLCTAAAEAAPAATAAATRAQQQQCRDTNVVVSYVLQNESTCVPPSSLKKPPPSPQNYPQATGISYEVRTYVPYSFHIFSCFDEYYTRYVSSFYYYYVRGSHRSH